MNNEQILKKISELERDIKELKEWKRKRELQQLSLPLDQESKEIINNYTTT